MRAMICTNYGTPDVFQLQEVETPTPKDYEVRIKIYAASVGPSDCTFRKASPIVKLVYGFRGPKNPIFGTELSGIIDAVGKKVHDIKWATKYLG
jgi:NADPH:quinone reductase-like Zn-dependent oxidoreductase